MADGVPGAASYVPSAADYAKFSDVGEGTMFAKEVLWLASVGVIRGANGRFGYSDAVKRSDLAAFLNRYDSQVLSASSAFAISGSGVSGGSLSLSAGGSVQLSAVNVPSGASAVTWWSDGGAVAVTGTGYIVGMEAGTCSVHVQAGDSTAVLKVTVK